MAGSLTQIELDGVKADQEAELDGTCVIWRVTSPGTISKVDATYSSPGTTTVYTGPAFCAPIVSRRDRFDVHGEQQVYQNQYRILVPWDVSTVKIGDLFQMTAAEDIQLLTKVMTIKDVLLVSDISLRRFTAIDIDE